MYACYSSQALFPNAQRKSSLLLAGSQTHTLAHPLRAMSRLSTLSNRLKNACTYTHSYGHHPTTARPTCSLKLKLHMCVCFQHLFFVKRPSVWPTVRPHNGGSRLRVISNECLTHAISVFSLFTDHEDCTRFSYATAETLYFELERVF